MEKSSGFSLLLIDLVFPITDIAVATIPSISPIFAGIIMVLFFLARLPNSSMYFSATRKFAAVSPPVLLNASATFIIPSAVARAINSISFACPSASLIRFCFSPSDIWIASFFNPSDQFIRDCLSPSEVVIAARFSRSAFICFSIASITVLGGEMPLVR